MYPTVYLNSLGGGGLERSMFSSADGTVGAVTLLVLLLNAYRFPVCMAFDSLSWLLVQRIFPEWSTGIFLLSAAANRVHVIAYRNPLGGSQTTHTQKKHKLKSGHLHAEHTVLPI